MDTCSCLGPGASLERTPHNFIVEVMLALSALGNLDFLRTPGISHAPVWCLLSLRSRKNWSSGDDCAVLYGVLCLTVTCSEFARGVQDYGFLEVDFWTASVFSASWFDSGCMSRQFTEACPDCPNCGFSAVAVHFWSSKSPSVCSGRFPRSRLFVGPQDSPVLLDKVVNACYAGPPWRRHSYSHSCMKAHLALASAAFLGTCSSCACTTLGGETPPAQGGVQMLGSLATPMGDVPAIMQLVFQQSRMFTKLVMPQIQFAWCVGHSSCMQRLVRTVQTVQQTVEISQVQFLAWWSTRRCCATISISSCSPRHSVGRRRSAQSRCFRCFFPKILRISQTFVRCASAGEDF